MNLSDVARIAAQGQQTVKLLDKHGLTLFRATKDWQSPLRSGGAAGCKGEHGDPTATTAAANLDGNGDPLALEHGLLVGELNAFLAAAVALSNRLHRLAPIDPNAVDRGRVNLVPSCIVCAGPAIPIRRGMCPKDHQAWLRADKPDLEGFKRQRQRAEDAAKVVVHEHEVA